MADKGDVRWPAPTFPLASTTLAELVGGISASTAARSALEPPLWMVQAPPQLERTQLLSIQCLVHLLQVGPVSQPLGFFKLSVAPCGCALMFLTEVIGLRSAHLSVVFWTCAWLSERNSVDLCLGRKAWLTRACMRLCLCNTWGTCLSRRNFVDLRLLRIDCQSLQAVGCSFAGLHFTWRSLKGLCLACEAQHLAKFMFSILLDFNFLLVACRWPTISHLCQDWCCLKSCYFHR